MTFQEKKSEHMRMQPRKTLYIILNPVCLLCPICKLSDSALHNSSVKSATHYTALTVHPSFSIPPPLFPLHHSRFLSSALWPACHRSTCSPTQGAGWRDLRRHLDCHTHHTCGLPAHRRKQPAASKHTRMHWFQSPAHSVRMARKLD
ncbi:hypothetical protein CHARACLAT_014612 [Characodon lateralis]|uniref:Uncharacterized protein n=1 Tax=Characodon lateralis TaxID=208331 RepID=A0ABU7D933_9TELE|nr:hypothetical protein [Characodon lateralis]